MTNNVYIFYLPKKKHSSNQVYQKLKIKWFFTNINYRVIKKRKYRLVDNTQALINPT